MKSINLSNAVATFIKSFEALIEANNTYQQALAKLKPLYDKAKLAEQIEIRNSVATLVGMKYGVVPKVMEQGANKGLLGFDAHGSDDEKRARDVLRKGFPTVTKKSVGTKPTVKKPASPVTKLLTQFKALTPAQRKAFLAEVL
jgi:hypothetical protein